MISIALRTELLARHLKAACIIKQRMSFEIRFQRYIEREVCASSAAGAEMRCLLSHVQNGFGIHFAEIGRHQRAADIHRVKSRMYGITRYYNPTDRDRAHKACGTGIGHDGAMNHRRCGHNQSHALETLSTF